MKNSFLMQILLILFIGCKLYALAPKALVISDDDMLFYHDFEKHLLFQKQNIKFLRSKFNNIYSSKDQEMVIREILTVLNMKDPNNFIIKEVIFDSTIVLHVNIVSEQKDVMVKVFRYQDPLENKFASANEMYCLQLLSHNKIIRTPIYYGGFRAKSNNNLNVYMVVAEWLEIDNTFGWKIYDKRALEGKNAYESYKSLGMALGRLHQKTLKKNVSGYDITWPVKEMFERLNVLHHKKYISSNKFKRITNLISSRLTYLDLTPNQLVFTHGDINPENWGFLPNGEISTFDFEKSGMAPPERDLARLETVRIDAFFAGKSASWSQEVIDVFWQQYRKESNLQMNESSFLIWRIFYCFSFARFWIDKDDERVEAWINFGLVLLDPSLRLGISSTTSLFHRSA